MGRLAELEAIHRDARGAARGRRWGTEQLNRSLFVVLVAQFQTYCRDLHDEAVDVYVAAANPRQAATVRRLLTQSRRLDTGNPRRSALGDDFGKLGIDLIPVIKARGTPEAAALDALDTLVDLRSAVAHGNESKLASVVASGAIKPTLDSYRMNRRSVEILIDSMDFVVASALAQGLGITTPW